MKQITILNTLAHPLSVKQTEQLMNMWGDYAMTNLHDDHDLAPEEYYQIRQTPILQSDDRTAFVFAKVIVEYDVALLPAGSPALMWMVAQLMTNTGTHIGFSYSKRISEERIENGKTVKTSTFDHICWQWL